MTAKRSNQTGEIVNISGEHLFKKKNIINAIINFINVFVRLQLVENCTVFNQLDMTESYPLARIHTYIHVCN